MPRLHLLELDVPFAVVEDLLALLLVPRLLDDEWVLVGPEAGVPHGVLNLIYSVRINIRRSIYNFLASNL